MVRRPRTPRRAAVLLLGKFSIFFVNVSAASSSRTCRSSSLYYQSSSAASSGALLVFTPPFQGRAPPGRRAQRSFPSRSAPPHHADVRGKGLSRRRRAASSVECRCHVGRAVMHGEGAVRGGERRMSRTSSGAWGMRFGSAAAHAYGKMRASAAAMQPYGPAPSSAAHK